MYSVRNKRGRWSVMPFGLFEDEMSPQMKVVLTIALLAVGWLALQTGALQAVLALGLASPTVAGLVVLGLLAYWALDELEDDDDATDVISKTSSRAESASQGFLSGSAALIMGVSTVGLTVGMDLFDGIMAFVDVAMTVPLASAQIGTALAGIAGALGYLAAPEVGGAALVLLIAAFVARRNETED